MIPRSRGARIRSNVFAYANLAPYVFFVLFPFYFMVVTSFKSNAELYDLKSIPFWIQSGAIMDHYALLFQKTDFVTWMKNSLLVATVATSASVVISILAGYSLARLRFRGAGSFGTAVFITYLVPQTLLFLPLSQVVAWLGLSDSILALMITYPTFLVPFCTWLLMGYFRTIPREVEECALVDGATRMQTLWKVVLPMAVPGIICAVLFSFTLCWNEFTYALTFISQSANKTAVVGVTSDLIRGDIYFWGSLMAGALLASIPIVVVYVLFLDYYVSGLGVEPPPLCLPAPASPRGAVVRSASPTSCSPRRCCSSAVCWPIRSAGKSGRASPVSRRCKREAPRSSGSRTTAVTSRIHSSGSRRPSPWSTRWSRRWPSSPSAWGSPCCSPVRFAAGPWSFWPCSSPGRTRPA